MADINYLSNISLGKINNWASEKAAEITPIPFPGQDAALTEGVDTLGVVATITIKGRLLGSFESIQNAIYNLRSIADGLQSSAQPLKSPFVNSNYLDQEDTADDGDTDSGSDGLTLERRQGNLGTNTSTGAFALTDSSANFLTWGITGNAISSKDKVKNLVTGVVANVVSIPTDTSLTLDADIFPSSGTAYAVTATIDVKVLTFNHVWVLPGVNMVDYTLEVIQVKE